MGTGICRTRNRGLTLIELLVALVVLGLCCVIAIPGYRQYTIRVNRTDAQRDLVELALRMQRCYSRTHNYQARECTLDVATNPEATYTTTVEKAVDTYTLIATPVNAQAEDTRCGRFTLNQAGARGVSGTLPAQQCWQQPGG